jgi:hypothetical protein
VSFIAHCFPVYPVTPNAPYISQYRQTDSYVRQLKMIWHRLCTSDAIADAIADAISS